MLLLRWVSSNKSKDFLVSGKGSRIRVYIWNLFFNIFLGIFCIMDVKKFIDLVE